MTAKPTYGDIIETDLGRLKVGSFYWIVPVTDVPDEPWEMGFQPARFNGMSAGGVPYFVQLGVICERGEEPWPVRRVGPEIKLEGEWADDPFAPDKYVTEEHWERDLST